MIGLALKLLGIGRWLKQAFSALLGFIGRYPWQALAIALLALSGWLWHGKGKAIAQRDHARAELVLSEDRHRQTKKDYTAAQQQAAYAESQRLARIKAQQERINTDAAQDYARRLADLRARYDRLRVKAGTGLAGAPGGQPLPTLPAAPGGPDEAAPDGLAWRLKASEQAIQLDELITWVEKQADVDPNEAVVWPEIVVGAPAP